MEQLDLESLGERIVKAARLAVAMHLYQAVDPNGQRGRDDAGLRPRGSAPRQQVVIGGSGPRVVDDVDSDAINDTDLRHG